MQTSAPGSKKVIFAGMAGNLLEWFDFAIYGFFAVTIGKLFFPGEDPVAQVIAAFGVFAVGFLMRPIGGMLLGHIGDRHGRDLAMMISVAAMAIPTFLVGMLPTYATLGLAAPILLLLLRMIQGLSVGGEYTTSVIYMVEHAPAKRRGFVGSFAVLGSVGGMLLGSAVGAVLADILTPEQLESWGWRLPFFMGLLLGVAGLYLRRHSGESVQPNSAQTRSPLLIALRDHWPVMLRVSGLSLVNAVAFYLLFVYLVSWLQFVDGLPPAKALEINTASMLLLLPVMLASGWLSDHIGGRILLFGSSLLIAVFAWPLFWLMHSDQWIHIQLAQMCFAVLLGTFLGAQPAYMVNMIAKEVRCSATGLAYNITLGVAGGLSPMAATWLVHRTHDDLSPAFLIIAAALISALAVAADRNQPHVRETSS